ncbi:MAG: hypothetical protein AAFP19_23190 [Bacteroidota bacterium]
MSRWYTLICCLFFLPVVSSSQTITISEDLSIRNDKYYKVVGKLKNRFLLFRDQATKFEVQAFDENLRLSWDKEIELDKKRPEILEVIPGKEHFDLFYKFRQKGRTVVKMHRYDPAANMQDSMTVVNYGNRFYNISPTIIYSENRKTALIYHYERQTEIEAIAFDLQQKGVIWQKKFKLPDLGFYREFQQILVDNSGTMYYVVEKKNKKSTLEDHHFVIYQCDETTEGVDQFKIPMDEYLTYDVYFQVDNLNNQLVAGGLYSEKNKGKANGYFYLRASTRDPKQQLAKYQAFDDEFVSNLLGKNVEDNKGITDIDVQELVLRRDGGILMIAERNREYERRMTSTGRGYIGRDGHHYIVDYYYDDICLLSLHPSGETHWKTILHKRQYSQDDEAVFSSFFLLKTPGNLRFLFNDEIRDENTVSEYIVNGGGEYDRNSLMSTDDQKIRLRFRDGLQVGARELIVPSERRNRLKLVRVQY